MSKENYLGLSLVFFVLSGGCLFGYHLIGASVDTKGLLTEPFALIPLGWFFLLLGLVTIGAYLWISKKS
jgi:DMSO reductase anchor subunit